MYTYPYTGGTLTLLLFALSPWALRSGSPTWEIALGRLRLGSVFWELSPGILGDSRYN